MTEYKLSIIGVEDFIIISPMVLGMLMQKVKESPDMNMEIPVESIMPPGFTQYLVNVLNSNRENEKFQFKQILDDPLEKEHIYKIIEYQMKGLQIEKAECFERFTLIVEDSNDRYNYGIETDNSFFCICKDEKSKFVYVYPDGRQESIILEWK